MSNKKQEQEEQTVEGSTTGQKVTTIIVTLIVCITVLMIASIVSNTEPQVVIEYEQLELCSLNGLTVGQQYEVNGKTMILEDISQNYNRENDLRLYFELVK